MDIATLVKIFTDQALGQRVMNNPLTQFGTKARRYAGFTLMPERNVPENQYREEGIEFRSAIANAGTRYSPVQLKGGARVASFDVVLGNSDIGSQFDGRAYDSLMKMIRDFNPSQADVPLAVLGTLFDWMDKTLVRPLIDHNEKNIWDAIVDASVVLTGDNGYTETVTYSDPSGHRFSAADSWSDDTYDPMEDISAAVNLLSSKGYTVSRIVAGRPVIALLQQNAIMRQRAGVISIMSGSVTGRPSTLDLTSLNTILARENLPAIEEYNLQYQTQASSDYFLKRDVMVFASTTGKDEIIDLGDDEPLVVENTLGYTAIGVPTGGTSSGRLSHLESFTNKPPRVVGEAWQTSLPVITEPEALVVIKDIA